LAGTYLDIRKKKEGEDGLVFGNGLLSELSAFI